MPRKTGTLSARLVVMTLAASIGIGAAIRAAYTATSAGRRAAATRASTRLDWDKLTQEATQLLSAYIQVNTSNPPGNELPAARMLREKFLVDGIPATIWESAPGRGVIAARLRGIGRAKAVVLLSHIDVVPAEPKGWRVPPFSGKVENGEIWGRGALDDKGPGIVELMAMLAIKRMGLLLHRDIIFLATPDEERGGAQGAGWVVAHKPELFADAGYLLNEGGGIFVRPHGIRLYTVSVTEKSPFWIRLTANGPEGHAAVPPEQTAVTRLITALSRLAAYRPPIRVIEPVRDYFRTMAKLDHGSLQLLDLASSLRIPAFRSQFLSVPSQNAQVRDTITPTVLSASDKTNVIPAQAYAEVDCRFLPGEDPKAFFRNIERIIDDKQVKITLLLNFPATSSPRKSPLMNAIRELAQRDNDAKTVATMSAGFTDSHYFREHKLVAYGFIPLTITPSDLKMVHGVNERISVRNLEEGIKGMVDLLRILGES
jgi:acetylornithine deacetylase/succinyl-diaminopimelate desuccinylase-like protein